MEKSKLEEAARDQFNKDFETFFHDDARKDLEAKAIALPEVIPTGVGRFGFFAGDNVPKTDTPQPAKKKGFEPT